MSKISKRAAVVTLAGVMTMGMLAGCGEKKLDGTQTVATVNGTEIPMGVLNLLVRQSQAQTEAMYAQFMGEEYAIWNTEMEEGVTYGQQLANDGLEQLELMYLMKEKAADYGVEVTEEDQKAIAEAAAAFMKANSEETIEKLSVTEDQVKTFLELRTYEARMYDPMVKDVDTEISDEESQQSSFSYVSVSTADLEEEEAKKKKEEAQKILDAVKAAPDADFAETVASVGEEYSAVDGTFDTNEAEPAEGEEEEDVYASSSYPEEVLSVLRTLKDGEIGPDVIETDTSYYVVKLNAKVDETATQEKKDSILEERKSELYTDTGEAWKEEAEITENEEVLETLTVKDNEKYKIVMPETEETEETPETTDEIADETGMEEEISDDEVLVPVEDEAELEADAIDEELIEEDLETEETTEDTAAEGEAEAETAAEE